MERFQEGCQNDSMDYIQGFFFFFYHLSNVLQGKHIVFITKSPSGKMKKGGLVTKKLRQCLKVSLSQRW